MNIFKLASLISIFLFLSACGGGSDSSPTPPPEATTYTLTATAGEGGSISPTSRSVTSGQTTTFTVTANTGYEIEEVTGCGGSLSGNAYTTGTITSACSLFASFKTESYQDITRVTLSVDKDVIIQNETVALSWTIDGTGRCEIEGFYNGIVTESGAVNLILSSVNEQHAEIRCAQFVASVEVLVLPERITIKDPVFADALNRSGYAVSGGFIDIEEALRIDKLCITGKWGYYGEPDENGTAIFKNISVPDTGVRCVYIKSGEYIQDLSGFEYFVNLRTFRIEHQKIDGINIRNMTSLIMLSLWGNPINQIDLSYNKSLEYLGLSETSLTSVNTAKLENLVEAALQNSKTSEFPYTLSNGTIVYGFTNLDFSRNRKLKRVYLHYNPIVDFGISHNQSSLEELWARGTSVTHLDLNRFTKLNRVIISESRELEFADLYGINNFNPPFRLFCNECPRLNEIIVHNKEAYQQSISAGQIGLDEHIKLVDPVD